MKINQRNNKIESLYIHIPFCNNICTYCDFSKFIYRKDWVDKYLRSLKREFLSYNINKNEIKTIYFGGGTPSSLTCSQIRKLLLIFKDYLKIAKEITFEANPESLDVKKLKLLYSFGVNRLSLGVETFNPDILRELNRKHTNTQVKNIISKARDAGFKNINIDLIYGYKSQTLADVKKDVEEVIKLNVEHISYYSLLVEEHTKLYNQSYKPLDDDTLRNYFDYIHQVLKKNKYIHYEVSNFAKKGYKSEHNLTYWNDQQYYGIGLSASGYIGNVRYKNTNNLMKYFSNQYKYSEELVDIKDDLTYYLMLKLRLKQGFNKDEFKNKFHFDINTVEPLLNKLENHKYLHNTNNQISLTYSGMMILDDIVSELLLEIEKNYFIE